MVLGVPCCSLLETRVVSASGGGAEMKIEASVVPFACQIQGCPWEVHPSG